MPRLARALERLGTETAFEVLVRAKKLEAEGHDVVHLEIGEPDFDTPRNIVEAGMKALDEGHTHYTPSAGIPELREVIAQHISEDRGIEVGASNVVVTPTRIAAIRSQRSRRASAEVKRDTAITRRGFAASSEARFAIRESDGPILPPAPRTMMSPSIPRIVSTRRGLGVLSRSSSCSTEAMDEGMSGLDILAGSLIG